LLLVEFFYISTVAGKKVLTVVGALSLKEGQADPKYVNFPSAYRFLSLKGTMVQG
jgi:hypothetical protein